MLDPLACGITYDNVRISESRTYLPADLRKAIASDAKALAAWEDITPLARNEWIAGPFRKKMKQGGSMSKGCCSELKEGMRGLAAGRAVRIDEQFCGVICAPSGCLMQRSLVLGIGISGDSTPTLTLSFCNLRLGHNSGAISFCLNLELHAKIAK